MVSKNLIDEQTTKINGQRFIGRNRTGVDTVLFRPLFASSKAIPVSLDQDSDMEPGPNQAPFTHKSDNSDPDRLKMPWIRNMLILL